MKLLIVIFQVILEYVLPVLCKDFWSSGHFTLSGMKNALNEPTTSGVNYTLHFRAI